MYQPPKGSRRVAIGLIWALMFVLAACGGRGTTPTSTAALTELPDQAPTPQPAVPVSPAPPANPTPVPETDPLGLMLRWRVSANDTIWDAALTDLTGGGMTDLVVSSHDKSLYALDSAGATYWSVQTGGPIYALALGDLDGDRRNETLIGGDDNKLRAIRPDGSEMWQHAEGTRITAVATGDLDRDGQDEVVMGVWSGEVVALDGSGSMKWRALVPGGPTALAVADIDRDEERRPEVVVATEQGVVLALDVAGHQLWMISDGGYIHQIVLSDLEADGASEVIAGTREGQVLTVGGDGEERWRLDVDFAIASLAVTDLDHDGLPDILAGGGPAPGGVVAILPAGAIRWTAETPGGVLSLAGGDLDQDGGVEVLAGGDDGFVSLFDPFGKLRGTYPTASRVRGIQVADLDSAAPPEVIVNAGDNVYVLGTAPLSDTGDPRPADPPTLPEARHDLMFEPSGPNTAELLFVGDVMLAKSIADRAGPFGPSYPFDATRGMINGADLTVLNLTSPLTQHGTPAEDKPLMYRAAPTMADGLQVAGFDVAMLANSHALDYGQVGLNNTRETLSERGIQSVGAGGNLAAALQPLVVEVEGIRIVFLAFTNGATGDYATGALAGVAPADVPTIQRAVRQAAVTADVVVVGLNTGNEYAAAPQESDVELARAAIDAGATLVIGTGAHVTQSTEVYGGGFIAYNIGNFVSDVDTNDDARNGTILRAVVTPVGLRTVDLIPIRIVADAQPRVLNDGTGHALVQRILPEGEAYSPPAASAIGDPGEVPNYSLAVALDYSAHLMRVTQSITLKNTTPDIWQEVVLSVVPSIFEDVFILQGATVTREGETSEVTPDLGDGFLRVDLPLPLSPGEVATIGLNYNLRLPPTDSQEWPPDGSLGFTADLVQAGDWYPVLAPYREQGWQTWAPRAVGDPTVYPLGDYDLSVQADEGIVVAGGGFTERQDNVWRFHLENARGIAFAASPDYEMLEGEANGVPVRSYCLPEYADAGQGALEAAIQALGLYSELYGPYPYNDLVVIQNGYFGAMEYSATASVSGFAYVTYGGKPESLVFALVAHEVAHQWWYGGVGNDQVNEPWLDEAFAMYSEHLFYEQLYPDALDWWQEERVDKLLEAGQPVPIDTTIYDYGSTRDLVYSMYGQAARFMDELRELMGDEAFFAFLQDYYQTNTGRIVTAQDFFDAVRRHTDADLEPLLERYFASAQP